ncbi:hypothetical protein KFE25_012220 [Diacronema lutheri]|uniref:Uncharacterized protein n=1 Tax=Diacronema lutheri TaxID=2081491 RepID=A0A8J5XNF3_DIALT|nr:hypothetical protein KFE25_012220 [Diacronema lutheri]
MSGAALLILVGCASFVARPAVVGLPSRGVGRAAPQLSATSELRAEQQRLNAVLARIATDLDGLRERERALAKEVAEKKAVQHEVLAALSVAYARTILEERKADLLAALAPPRPAGARVELLIDALLAAAPRATGARKSTSGWRQAWPKLSFFDALFTTPQPPVDAVLVDDTVAVAKSRGADPSLVFVRVR